MICVGGISVTVPPEMTLPRPASTWPRGPLGRMAPNWNMARRIMGVPTSTFSLVTSSMNLSGAMMATLPAFTSASSDHAAHAAEMIDVGVGVDHGRHRLPAAMRAVELERGGGDLGRDQRIDDDEAAAALDDRHVGDVEAAHLVDAVGDLEQAVVHVEPRLPPQARVDRVGRPARARGRRSPSASRSRGLPGCGRSTSGSVAMKPRDGVLEILACRRTAARRGRSGCARRSAGVAALRP